MRLAGLSYLALVLLGTCPSLILGQGNKPLKKIYQQSPSLTVRPLSTKPGEILTFTYKVYPDTLPPHQLSDAKVKLRILPLSRSNPKPSLDFDSFTHLQSYILKANRGGSVPANFPFTKDFADSTVIYSLGDVKIDSLRQKADTLAFEFSYKVVSASATGFNTCVGLVAGIEAQFLADGGVDYGSKFATSDLKTESQIIWDFKFDPEKAEYEPRDSLDLKITYRNEGNVEDIGAFSIVLPFPIRASETNTSFLTLPSGVTARFSASGDSIIFRVNPFSIDRVEREIRVRIRFTIRTAHSADLGLKATLIANCDASAQRPRGESKSKSIRAKLANLLAVSKSAQPAMVAPGDTITYTITLIRPPGSRAIAAELDTVSVLDDLEPGIAAIIPVNLPLKSNLNNRNLAWEILNFAADRQEIIFKAVLRRDYYPAIVANPGKMCLGDTLINSVSAFPAQNEPDEILEGVDGDNDGTVGTLVKPLGDLLRIQDVRIVDANTPGTILPGDTIRYEVQFENASAFAASGLFSLVNTLPSLQYASMPFEISPANAKYEAVQNLIRLDSLNFSARQRGSLVFKVRVRDDVQFCQDVPITNFARLILSGVDCELSNNTFTATNSIANPKTALTLQADILRADADHNDIVDLLIVYGSGSSLIPIKNIIVEDSLDAGLKFISSVPPVDSTRNGKLSWKKLPALQPGQIDTIRLRVQLLAAEPCKADTLLTKARIFSNPAVCAAPPAATDAVILRGTDDQLTLRYATSPSLANPLNAGNQDSIEYKLTITNNSQIAAQHLTVTDTPPASSKFNITLISPGGNANAAPGKIIWKIALLAAGDSATVSFKGKVIDRLYCTPDSLVNQFVFQGALECSRDSARTVYRLLARPEIRQLRLLGFTYRDDNGNRLIEPNERVTLCLSFTGDTTFNNIAFKHPVRGANNLIVVMAQDTVLAAPAPNNRTTLVAGEAVEFCFSFRAPANITRDSLFVEGLAASNLNCGQQIGKLALPARGAALLAHDLQLRGEYGNAFIKQGEWITATVSLAHQPNSGFDADSVALHLIIRVEQPGTAPIEPLRYSQAVIDTLIPFLAKGSQVNWPVRFQYPDLTPVNQRIVATAYFTRSGFHAMRSADIEKNIDIAHDCFAKPRTFIPAVHPNGLQFKPDDGLDVFIFDLDGNKVWDGKTNKAWDGKTKNGSPAPPGTYIYVIDGQIQCKGTIVLLR